MCGGIEPSRFARSIALSGYPGQPEFHTIQVLPGLEPRLLDSKSSVLTNYTTEPCLREWKLGEIMTNNSRFSSCTNVIIKFIQKYQLPWLKHYDEMISIHSELLKAINLLLQLGSNQRPIG